jgi:hypothetical protein
MSLVNVLTPSQITVTALTENSYTVVTTVPTAISISVDASAGPIGLPGATGPAGANVTIYYGTGSAPSAIGEPDGTLFLKYT